MTPPKALGLASICLAFGVAACNPQISGDFYSGDVVDVLETGNPVVVPVRLGMPIQNEKKCEEHKNKMLPALERNSKKVKFLNCEDVQGKMYDLMNVEMDVEIVKGMDLSDGQISGMFGVRVARDEANRAEIIFVKTPKAAKAIKEIDAVYQYQTIELKGIEIKIRFNNDLRQAAQFVVGSSYVDGRPVDQEASFELKRRGVIEVVPSNVRSQGLIANGQARFGALLLD